MAANSSLNCNGPFRVTVATHVHLLNLIVTMVSDADSHTDKHAVIAFSSQNIQHFLLCLLTKILLTNQMVWCVLFGGNTKLCHHLIM